MYVRRGCAGERWGAPSPCPPASRRTTCGTAAQSVAANQPLQSNVTQRKPHHRPPTPIDRSMPQRSGAWLCSAMRNSRKSWGRGRLARVPKGRGTASKKGAHIGEAATTSQRAQVLEVCFVAARHGMGPSSATTTALPSKGVAVHRSCRSDVSSGFSLRADCPMAGCLPHCML